MQQIDYFNLNMSKQLELKIQVIFSGGPSFERSVIH